MSVQGADDPFPRTSPGAAGIRDTVLAGVGVGRQREEQRCLDQELRWLSAQDKVRTRTSSTVTAALPAWHSERFAVALQHSTRGLLQRSHAS